MEETARPSNVQKSPQNHHHQDQDHDHDHDHDHDLDPDPWKNTAEHHVLVVQIPKDQIYRVPPPENALIAKRHQNPEKHRCRDPPCCCCICVIVSIVLLLIFILVMGLVPSIPSLFLMPNNPTFTIDAFSIKNSSKTWFEFDIIVKVENTNPMVGVLYEEDGSVKLSFKKKEITAVKFPGLELGRDDRGNVKLGFRGSIGDLPKEVEKSMKRAEPKVAVSFGLEMDVNTRMKVGVSNSRNIKFTVLCSFKVDTLAAKGSRAQVVSQQCGSNRKIL